MGLDAKFNHQSVTGINEMVCFEQNHGCFASAPRSRLVPRSTVALSRLTADGRNTLFLVIFVAAHSQ